MQHFALLKLTVLLNLCYENLVAHEGNVFCYHPSSYFVITCLLKTALLLWLFMLVVARVKTSCSSFTHCSTSSRVKVSVSLSMMFFDCSVCDGSFYVWDCSHYKIWVGTESTFLLETKVQHWSVGEIENNKHLSLTFLSRWSKMSWSLHSGQWVSLTQVKIPYKWMKKKTPANISSLKINCGPFPTFFVPATGYSKTFAPESGQKKSNILKFITIVYCQIIC